MNFLFPIYYSLVQRMCGDRAKWGGIPLYAMPYMMLFADRPIIALLVFIWVFMWRISGHADAFENVELENTLSKIVVPISKLFNIDRKSKVYDALFWFIKGLILTSLPAILSGNYLLFISAITYPLGYWIGYRLPNKYVGNIEWGEFLSGFGVGLSFIGAF